ncbi:MAG: acylneuraminate cytidylyltransferase family protein [Pseudomonadota bacterium]
MKTVAFIFARGGSKGLPNKNIRQFKGLPLIGHSIQFAQKHPDITDVVVSTDSEEIAGIARDLGARVPFLRPAELATDSSPEILSWRHAVDFYQNNISSFDLFLNLPAVSPLRDPEDISLIHDQMTNDWDMVLSVTESDANPYFNLLEQNADSGFQLCSGQKGSPRRQEAKPVYRIVPMYYACKPSFPFQFNGVLEGNVGTITIPKKRAIDIDTLEDFHYLEFITSEKGQSFDNI